jgi:hypothetical protein
MPTDESGAGSDRPKWRLGQRVSRKNSRALGTIAEVCEHAIKIKWDGGDKLLSPRRPEQRAVERAAARVKGRPTSAGGLTSRRACLSIALSPLITPAGSAAFKSVRWNESCRQPGGALNLFCVDAEDVDGISTFVRYFYPPFLSRLEFAIHVPQ